jgi:hypothetical protein
MMCNWMTHFYDRQTERTGTKSSFCFVIKDEACCLMLAFLDSLRKATEIARERKREKKDKVLSQSSVKELVRRSEEKNGGVWLFLLFFPTTILLYHDDWIFFPSPLFSIVLITV